MSNGIKLAFDRNFGNSWLLRNTLYNDDVVIYTFDRNIRLKNVILRESNQSIQEEGVKIKNISPLENGKVININNITYTNICAKFRLNKKSNKYWQLSFDINDKNYLVYIDFIHQITKTIFVFSDVRRNCELYFNAIRRSNNILFDSIAIMQHVKIDITDILCKYIDIKNAIVVLSKCENVNYDIILDEYEYVNNIEKFYKNINEFDIIHVKKSVRKLIDNLMNYELQLPIPKYRFIRFMNLFKNFDEMYTKNYRDYSKTKLDNEKSFEILRNDIIYWQSQYEKLFKTSLDYHSCLHLLGLANEGMNSYLNDQK